MTIDNIPALYALFAGFFFLYMLGLFHGMKLRNARAFVFALGCGVLWPLTIVWGVLLGWSTKS